MYMSTGFDSFWFTFSTGCDISLTAVDGDIFSPGFGVIDYAHYQTCVWTVQSPKGESLTMTLEGDFNIVSPDTLEVININLLLLCNALMMCEAY